MRILFVITGLGMGGAETVVTNLADQMVLRGHEVKIAYLQGEVLVRPRSDSIELVNLNLTSVAKFLLSSKLYRRLLQRFQPDVVHAHMFHSNIFTRLNRIFKRKSRLICTSHSANEGGRVRMMLYRYSNWLSDLNTNVSVDATSSLVKKGAYSKDNILTVYNGIDIRKFTSDFTQNHMCNKGDILQFLSVGRFNVSKDYPNLFSAIDQVRNVYKNIHFNIVGDGELRGELESLIIDLNLTEYVTLLGRRDDVPQLMQHSDFFVLSSAWEGFGLVVAEAMASQLFVIATDCGGVKEVMGGYGILVPPKDSNLLSEGIIQAIKLSPEVKQINNKSARLYVEDNFDLNCSVDKWLELYTSS